MDDLWKKTDKELAKIEKKLEKIYQEAYKDLAEKWDQYMSQANSEVAPFEKAYQKAKESGDAAEIQKAGIALSEAKKKATVQNAYWQGMVNQVAERYEHVNETALAYVNGKIPGIYAMNLNGTLQEIETEAGKVKMGVAFDMVDERTVRNLAKSDKTLFPQKKMDKAKDKAWNKKAINSQILQGILQGESIPKIAHRLQNVTDMNAAAATRNARTMCTTAENNGRLSGLKEAEEKGIVYEKQWMSTHDDRTRESHQELDGVSVPVDEEFPNGLMYPGDPDGEPEEVYNCRCSLIRKLVGFKRKDGSISEVGEIHQYNPDYFQTSEPEQASQAEQSEGFKPGDEIYNSMFGPGTLVSIDGEWAAVDFDGLLTHVEVDSLQNPEDAKKEPEKEPELVEVQIVSEPPNPPPLEDTEEIKETLAKEASIDHEPITETKKFMQGSDADEYFRGTIDRDKKGSYADDMRGYSITNDPNKPATKWMNKLTDDQKAAINDYSGSTYEPMNDYLRGLTTKKKAEQQFDAYTNTSYKRTGGQFTMSEEIKQLDAGLAKFNLDEPITVYRGSGREIAGQLQVGDIFHDCGYMSTATTKSGGFSGGVQFEITVPSGKGWGAYIDGLSNFEGSEYEFLLARGSDLLVESREERGGTIYVRATVIGQSKGKTQKK